MAKRRTCGEDRGSNNIPLSLRGDAVKSFLRSLSGLVFGMLAGFDRLVFQGHLRPLFFPGGMKRYCNANDLLLKEFKDHSQTVTKQLIAASEQAASAQNRPIEYLRSPKLRKEDHARRVAQRDGIQEGLIGVFRQRRAYDRFAASRVNEAGNAGRSRRSIASPNALTYHGRK